MAFRKLTSDRQFEKAFISHYTVCVRDKGRRVIDYIGSVEGFNPIVVTVGGKKFMRDDFDFVSIR